VPLSVVVLAAGQGKRMRSALPKVLQPLAGAPMLSHVIERARETGAEAVHVVYGHGGDAVRERFAGAPLEWRLQAERLGTGHAVLQAMPGIPDDHDVLVLCGDVPLVRTETLEALVAAAQGAGIAVLTARVSDPTGYGRVVRDAGDAVVKIVEQQDATADEATIDEINTGLLCARASKLKPWLARLDNDNAQCEFYLTDVVGFACADGARVGAVMLEDAAEAMGINDKSQLAEAERRLQARRAEQLLEQGVTLADPARIDVRGSLTVGADVFIDVNAVLIGNVTLGDGVSVGPNCVIKDSSLGAGTVVHAHSVVEGIVAGERCELGPFARMRPTVTLSNGVKIGNFVEIKNSEIADGSKVNHLSYVGDTSIGSGVNVGAGTITCNYDGAFKHRTTIGDGAFIGSGCNLVAPVDVGAGATIGAGSTISKSAPAGELTVARTRQTTVAGWKRPVKPAKSGGQGSSHRG
jgi:bifunctional UDP-N-acetylglucosamine pyrophosphorylase / glucosamine-1-phosphate N-acetyltransferase